MYYAALYSCSKRFFGALATKKIILLPYILPAVRLAYLTI
jgi:hypothetical protein